MKKQSESGKLGLDLWGEIWSQGKRIRDLEATLGHPETSELKATGMVEQAARAAARQERGWEFARDQLCRQKGQIDGLQVWVAAIAGIGIIALMVLFILVLHR